MGDDAPCPNNRGGKTLSSRLSLVTSQSCVLFSAIISESLLLCLWTHLGLGVMLTHSYMSAKAFAVSLWMIQQVFSCRAAPWEWVGCSHGMEAMPLPGCCLLSLKSCGECGKFFIAGKSKCYTWLGERQGGSPKENLGALVENKLTIRQLSPPFQGKIW